MEGQGPRSKAKAKAKAELTAVAATTPASVPNPSVTTMPLLPLLQSPPACALSLSTVLSMAGISNVLMRLVLFSGETLPEPSTCGTPPDMFLHPT
jgi:hypothetical protein